MSSVSFPKIFKKVTIIILFLHFIRQYRKILLFQWQNWGSLKLKDEKRFKFFIENLWERARLHFERLKRYFREKKFIDAPPPPFVGIVLNRRTFWLYTTMSNKLKSLNTPCMSRKKKKLIFTPFWNPLQKRHCITVRKLIEMNMVEILFSTDFQKHIT